MRTREERAEPTAEELDALAEHFDQTDTAELAWDEATDMAIERPELEQISIRLPKEDLVALKRRAARSGVGYTPLVRMILRQHLRNPLARSQSATRLQSSMNRPQGPQGRFMTLPRAGTTRSSW